MGGAAVDGRVCNRDRMPDQGFQGGLPTAAPANFLIPLTGAPGHGKNSATAVGLMIERHHDAPRLALADPESEQHRHHQQYQYPRVHKGHVVTADPWALSSCSAIAGAVR